jgi:hypothetical protein
MTVQRLTRWLTGRAETDDIAPVSRLKLVVPLLAALLAPAAAHADKITLGSSLVPDAAISQSNPRDWGAYPTAEGDGSPFAVNVQGEVSYAQIKGSILQPRAGYPDPNVVMHVVVLRPQPDGRDQLIVATDNLTLPYGGDPNRVSDYNLQSFPSHICVQPGDHIALATSGGFGNQFPQYGGFPDDSFKDGAQFQMFGRVPGSSFNVFKQPPGDDTWQVPDNELFTPVTGQELLMRVTVGTGADARYFCRTPAEQKQGCPDPGTTITFKTPCTDPVDVPEPSHAPYVKLGKVPLRIYCRRIESCVGTLTIARNGATIGTVPFTLAYKTSGHLTVALAKGWRGYLPKKGSKAAVTVTATLNDGKAASRNLTLLRKK